MSATGEAIRSLVLPLSDSMLVVPASAVEEVLFAEAVDTPPPGCPVWLIGEVQMRQHTVPLVCFEALVGEALPEIAKTEHAVVLKNLDADGEPTFYAIRLQRAPRVEELDTATLQLADDGASDNPFVACRVIVDGQEGGLPALDQLVNALSKAYIGC